MNGLLVAALTASSLLAAGTGVIALRRQCRSDLAAARNHISNLGATVVDTKVGPIEFRIEGTGIPVLAIHGIWGGFDQAMLNVGHALDTGFKRIFISRFGYLGSPMPTNASVALQADLYAALLDGLGIGTVGVIGHSAGSTSALQFALRHPHRVSGLVVVSPNAPGPVRMTLPPRPITELMFRSATLFWLLVRYFPRALRGIMGVPKGFALAQPDYQFLERIALSILPSDARVEGTLFDAFVSNPSIASVPLQQVKANTLVVAAKDDPLALYKNSSRLAALLPRGRLITAELGGHMLLGQSSTIEPQIAEFLWETGGVPAA